MMLVFWLDTKTSERRERAHSNIVIPAQILIGAIIEKSPADKDGRLRPGDELMSVDGIHVAGKPHRYVIDLMHGAARNGQVKLTVRRRLHPTGEKDQTFRDNV